MKLLVTGGAGYIGSHTVAALLESGNKVVIYDNLSTGHEWVPEHIKHGLREKGITNINCELVIGDISDTETLRKVFLRQKESGEPFDGVIHFAASSLVGESGVNPAKYYENNVIGTKRFLDAMVEANVKNLVFSSTCATYGIPESVPITEREKQEPINTYGWTKFMIERMMQDYARAYGLNAVALRYFNAAGASFEYGIGEAHAPETHVIPLLLQVACGDREAFSLFGDDYDTHDGSCIRDYIHVKDLASAHISAMRKLLAAAGGNGQGSFSAYNLGTGNGGSVLELISVVEEVTGKKIKLERKERRAGDPPELVADSTLAMNDLNWKPVHSAIEEIIRDAFNWACCNKNSSE